MNFNDTAVTSLATKYKLLQENLNQVVNDLVEQRKQLKNFRTNQDDIQGLIGEKGDQLTENIESSIQKMDGEIQKSLSHQKAENSRLQQQITQLNTDNTIIKKEYEKLFNKLSRKYKDKELYSQIKNKLYQKGFSYDEINNYIKTVD